MRSNLFVIYYTQVFEMNVADYHCLVVDDDVLTSALIISMLRKLQVARIDIAENGEVALEYLAAGKRSPDLIISDLHMPKSNGVELICHLAEKKFAGGIILISGRNQHFLKIAADLAKAHNLNLLGTLSKPLTPSGLQGMLSHFNETKRAAAVLPLTEQFPPVDLTNLRSFSDGDKKEECRFIALFIQQNSETLERLRVNCVDGESTEWVEAAHLIKGASASIGATYLCTIAEKAQNLTVGTAEDRRKHLLAMTEETERVRLFLISQGLFSDDVTINAA